MTAIAFPMTDDMRARLDARAEPVEAARALIRSEALHTADDIRDACHALMTYGNHWDWAEAYHVLRALDARRAEIQAEAAAHAKRGTIRAALVDIAGLLVIVAVAYAAYLMGNV